MYNTAASGVVIKQALGNAFRVLQPSTCGLLQVLSANVLQGLTEDEVQAAAHQSVDTLLKDSTHNLSQMLCIILLQGPTENVVQAAACPTVQETAASVTAVGNAHNKCADGLPTQL